MNKIPEGTWVLVADGTGARLFHSMGKGPKVSLKQQKLLEQEDLIDEAPSGNRPPEQSAQAKDEAAFAKQLANSLNSGALKQEYAHLVLMADPQTLGQLRPMLHGETVKRLVEEVAKTFTNAPLEDIEAALS